MDITITTASTDNVLPDVVPVTLAEFNTALNGLSVERRGKDAYLGRQFRALVKSWNLENPTQDEVYARYALESKLAGFAPHGRTVIVRLLRAAKDAKTASGKGLYKAWLAASTDTEADALIHGQRKKAAKKSEYERAFGAGAKLPLSEREKLVAALAELNAIDRKTLVVTPPVSAVA